MDSNQFIAIGFICQILSSQTAISLNASFLSSPVITRNHRRLKGFPYKAFQSLSLLSCGLQCQRQPQCVSVNFLKVARIDETEGVCELNNWGIELPIQENEELEYEEGVIYAQFRALRVSLREKGTLRITYKRKCTDTFHFCTEYEIFWTSFISLFNQFVARKPFLSTIH